MEILITINGELHLIPAIFKQSKSVDFHEIRKTFQNMDEKRRPVTKNLLSIVRIVLTRGATSATPKPFFNAEENENLA